MKNNCVVLMNLGGPDSLEAVQPFLENLFNDPDIFKLPFQSTLARFISRRRAPKIQKEYAMIGGKSPIGEWTELQRAMLETELKRHFNPLGIDFSVYTAMRYWHPSTTETANIVSQKNFDTIILLPLYPHFSMSTTGSSFNEWSKRYSKTDARIIQVDHYHTEPKYLQAVNQRIDESLAAMPREIAVDVQLVFSAHGTPVSYMKRGDPYSFQIQETIKEIMEMRKYSHQHHLCFQSKVGPMKWLEPSTLDTIKKAAIEGKKHLLIIPISFVSDHVETLFELNIEYREIAEHCGTQTYQVMRGLNDSPLFIEALRDVIKGLKLSNE